MNLLMNDNPYILWRDTVKEAEQRCDIELHHELETYLVTLLHDYTRKPDVTKQVFATSLLKAHAASKPERLQSFQTVGDTCLIFAGLFPHAAQKKLVKISYFVNVGRSAYISISNDTEDLFGLLAYKFVTLMDVLQSIRPDPDLLPLEAFEQWQELGSKRALRILSLYTRQGSLPKLD